MKCNAFFLFSLLVLVIGVSGCSKDEDPDDNPVVPAGYSQGVFVVNEGPFQAGSGTITFLNRDGSGQEEKIYQEANGGDLLGNIVQSMNVEPTFKTDAYIAVNNANKIEVVNLSTFEHIQTIENINTPRYIEFGGNEKMYVSCWDNTVKVLSTVGYEFLGQVDVGTGPEKLLRVGNSIWVLNQGGFAIDSTLSIVSTETDQVVETILVYPKPTGIQVDANGLVWVMCSGSGWNGFPSPGDTEAHLLCIHPDNFSILKDFAFPTTDQHPEKLVINKEKDQLYFNYPDGIYRFDTKQGDLEPQLFIQTDKMFYGLGLDPETNILYASDPVDFAQKGKVYRFDANSGNAVDSFDAGIVPGTFFFTGI